VSSYKCIFRKNKKKCDCGPRNDCDICHKHQNCKNSLFDNPLDLFVHYLSVHDFDESKILNSLDDSKSTFKIQKSHENEKIAEADYFMFLNEDQKAILNYINSEKSKKFEKPVIKRTKKTADVFNKKLISNLNVVDKKVALKNSPLENSRSKRMFVNYYSSKKDRTHTKNVISKQTKKSFVNDRIFFNL
jgi:hypothetical protein